MKKGFVVIPLLIAITGLIAATGVYVLYKSYTKKVYNSENTQKVSVSPTTTPTLTPSLTPTPTPKHTPTKKPNTPTPKPTDTPQTGCSKFKPEDGLTSIKITLKEKDNKPLTGDWIVKIKPSGSCPGSLPPNWGQINEVIHQPNYTYTSPNLGPGQFRVDVQYHYTGEGFDWDGTSGNHSREITVSN